MSWPTDDPGGLGGRFGAFFEVVARADVAEALRQVRQLLREGVTPDQVITGLLVPVQDEVGRRWERNEWTVAHEHAVTAVVQAVLGALVVDLPSPSEPHGAVVVACAEEEWHSLPARLTAERLGLRGWPVVFLGASTPASHLARFLRGGGYLGVVVSCSVPMFLPGVLRSVEAAHSAGLPTVVGGRALGIDELRAERLGADAWCPSVERLADTLAEWERAPPSRLAVPELVDQEHLRLEAVIPESVESAVGHLGELWTPLREYSAEQIDRTREDLGYLLRFLVAAVLTDDQRVLEDYLAWLPPVLETRGLAAPVVRSTLLALRRALPVDLRRSRALIADVLATQSPS